MGLLASMSNLLKNALMAEGFEAQPLEDHEIDAVDQKRLASHDGRAENSAERDHKNPPAGDCRSTYKSAVLLEGEKEVDQNTNQDHDKDEIVDRADDGVVYCRM